LAAPAPPDSAAAAVPESPVAATPAGAEPPLTSEPAAPAEAEPAATDSAAPSANASVELDPVNDWEGTIQALTLKGLATELAANTTPVDWQNGRLRLALRPSHGHLAGERYRRRLEQALGERLGERVTIELVKRGDDSGETPTEAAGRRDETRRAEAERAIENDPVVQAFQERFGAEVEQGSVRPAADSDAGSTPGSDAADFNATR
jgi:DNA polymerase-3 subunit gamma/tau